MPAPPVKDAREPFGLKWETFSVKESAKQPLYRLLREGLEASGCEVIFMGPDDEAPVPIVFDTATGERQGLLVYAFRANDTLTRHRPPDEHRFQIKYGGNLKRSFEVATDLYGLVSTLFLGIDTERRLFFALDPMVNTPCPMSRSVEYKQADVDRVLDTGWHSWTRARNPPRTKTREAASIDARVELVTGGRVERLADLVRLERLARGLDPGERHLIADKIAGSAIIVQSTDHPLLDELAIDQGVLFDLIQNAKRLKMAVRGWVAEEHLHRLLETVDGVTDCLRLEEDGKPDFSLRWRGGAPLLIECKNSLRERYADQRIKVDFQRTRASPSDPCSRYYAPDDFAVLAVCVHAVTEQWAFELALTQDLDPHRKCTGKLASNVGITAAVFSPDVADVLERHATRRHQP